MKAINVAKEGKAERLYIPVNERLMAFREDDKYKDWSLISEIIELDKNVATIKGIIKDEKGIERASGIASENKDSSFINKGSYVENAETSAWGRALGNLGIGINTSIATKDDMEKVAYKHELRVCKKQVQELYTAKASSAGSVDTLNKSLGVTAKQVEALMKTFDSLIEFEKRLAHFYWDKVND